jgi:phosphatidylglycerophosphate synthase
VRPSAATGCPVDPAHGGRERKGPTLSVSLRGVWLLSLVAAGLTAAAMRRSYGRKPGLRFAAGTLTALSAQHLALDRLMRRTGVSRVSAADLLTLSRATAGSVLAGLAASGVRDRLGTQDRLGWLAVIWGEASDMFDGRLARRAGASGMGKTLDIESDSWLNLWSAASATAWAGLPRWCLLPPVLGYIHPLLELRDGRLPVGGGPWWGRLAGGAQNVFLFLALAPTGGRLRDRGMRASWLPVDAGQLAAIAVALIRRRALHPG